MKMRNLLFILSALSLVFFSCDDGDILDVELDFEDTFQTCPSNNDIVLFKTKEIPSESLSVLISNFSISEVFNLTDNDSLKIEKDGTFNYRTYDDDELPSSLFCSAIPSEVNITNDYPSSCKVNFLTVLTEDDNDGIPAELEGKDPNGDGDFTDSLDTDSDGIYDFMDVDDDGDNVLTKDEDINDDGDFTNDDSDGNGTPDYLDNDDDGDGTLTRDEEKGTPNQDPTDDETTPDAGPDYLNPLIKDILIATKYRKHSIQQTYEVSVIINNIDLDDLLSQPNLPFGFLTRNGSLTNTREEEPEL